MKKINSFFTVSILSALIAITSCSSVLAQTPSVNSVNTPETTSINTPSSSSNSKTTLPNPIGVDDPRIIVGNIIRLILGLVGSLALIFFIYGGLMWMTSAGNSDQVTKGRDTLVWATLGLIVIFASYTGVAFILQSLGGV